MQDRIGSFKEENAHDCPEPTVADVCELVGSGRNSDVREEGKKQRTHRFRDDLIKTGTSGIQRQREVYSKKRRVKIYRKRSERVSLL